MFFAHYLIVLPEYKMIISVKLYHHVTPNGNQH